MIEMNFALSYLDRHPFPNHIRDYESCSTLVGLLKTEIDCANNFNIDVSFSIKALSSPSAC